VDNLTKEQRRRNMQSIRSRDTKPERMIMFELKRKKIYFSRYVNNIFGKPDIVFRKKKLIVFVDSDFWHANPKRFSMPKTNVDYWREKIKRNKNRDKKVNSLLKKEGWKVIRLWEEDIKKNTDRCLNKILHAYYKQPT